MKHFDNNLNMSKPFSVLSRMSLSYELTYTGFIVDLLTIRNKVNLWFSGNSQQPQNQNGLLNWRIDGWSTIASNKIVTKRRYHLDNRCLLAASVNRTWDFGLYLIDTFENQLVWDDASHNSCSVAINVIFYLFNKAMKTQDYLRDLNMFQDNPKQSSMASQCRRKSRTKAVD